MAEKRKGPARGDARDALLGAALCVIRERGYAATTVDALCAAAGVTKGAFFHHFASKEDLAIAAARHWSETTGALFAAAPHHALEEPAARVLGYVAFRKSLLQGEPAEFTCLVGTMLQEAFAENPRIQAACAQSIFGHAQSLEADFEAALAAHGIDQPGLTAAGLARYTQAAIQGAFILAKAQPDAARARAIASEAIDHLDRYLRLLFACPPAKETTP